MTTFNLIRIFFVKCKYVLSGYSVMIMIMMIITTAIKCFHVNAKFFILLWYLYVCNKLSPPWKLWKMNSDCTLIKEKPGVLIVPFNCSHSVRRRSSFDMLQHFVLSVFLSVSLSVVKNVTLAVESWAG